jgi:hypothetical protein
LNDQFQVSGFIKPGVGTKTILKQITNEIDNLSSNDFIILSCGSNDVGSNQLSEVFNDIVGFIKRVTHTRVMLLTVPIRYDLESANNGINSEITKFNKKLCKLSKLFSHLSVCEIDVNRNYYTKYGSHLNGLGKKMVTLTLTHLIVSLIKMTSNVNNNIIPLGFYEAQSQLTDYFPVVNQTISQNIIENKKSKRIKKKTITGTQDF